MIYEWDDEKNKINIKKHCISFEEAQTIFEDPLLQISNDDGFYQEERFRAIGTSQRGRNLLVVFCERFSQEDNIIRIISSRKLTRSEIKRLEKL